MGLDTDRQLAIGLTEVTIEQLERSVCGDRSQTSLQNVCESTWWQSYKKVKLRHEDV
jgi:hypothetical protein